MRHVNPRQCSARPVSQQRTQPLAGRVSPSQWFGPGPPCPTTWPAAGTSFGCGTGHVLLMHLRAVRCGTGYHHLDQALRHRLRRPRIVVSYWARDLTRGNRLPWLSIRCQAAPSACGRGLPRRTAWRGPHLVVNSRAASRARGDFCGKTSSSAKEWERTRINERIAIPITIVRQLRITAGPKEDIPFLAMLLDDIPRCLTCVRVVQLLRPGQ